MLPRSNPSNRLPRRSRRRLCCGLLLAAVLAAVPIPAQEQRDPAQDPWYTEPQLTPLFPADLKQDKDLVLGLEIAGGVLAAGGLVWAIIGVYSALDGLSQESDPGGLNDGLLHGGAGILLSSLGLGLLNWVLTSQE